MALIQFRDEVRKINVTKRMFAPKKHVCDVMQWYKDAGKLIKELPVLCLGSFDHHNNCVMPHGTQHPNEPKAHWHLAETPYVTPKWIKFTLVNMIGEKSHLIIDRSVPAIG
jgi:hypothetical protein